MEQDITNTKISIMQFFRKIFAYPLHPFILVIYLSLLFISNDIETGFPFGIIYLPTAILLAFVTFFISIGYALSKEIHKTSLIVTVFLFMNYAFSPIKDIFVKTLRDWTITGGALGFSTQGEQTLYIFAIWTIFILLILICIKRMKIPNKVTKIVNIFCIVLLLQIIINISTTYRAIANVVPETIQAEISATQSSIFPLLNVETKLNTRDYYFIIIDRYPGKESLLEFFGYDNSNFIKNLKSLGFSVIENSSSNTGQTSGFTRLVMNMNYASDPYELGYFNDPAERYHLSDFFKRNEFTIYGAYGLHPAVYRTQRPALIDEHLRPIYSFADMPLDSAISEYIQSFVVDEYLTYSYIGRFFLIVNRVFNFNIIPILKNSKILEKYKNYIVIQPIHVSDEELFKKVRDVSLEPGKKFIYVHFRGTGGITKDGVGHNENILDMVSGILKNSSTPPVIVIVSDHGIYPTSTRNINWKKDIKQHKAFIEKWGCYFEEGATRHESASSNYMVNNFQAYFLPDGGESTLYDTITPVNAWRMILNYYFEGNLEQLDDVSYWRGINRQWYKVRENGRVAGCLPVNSPNPLNE